MVAGRTIPTGYTRSAWVHFDEHARHLIAEEFMAANPGWSLPGPVDWSSPEEPLFYEAATGSWATLLGEYVDFQGVSITRGNMAPETNWLWLAALALGASLAYVKR